MYGVIRGTIFFFIIPYVHGEAMPKDPSFQFQTLHRQYYYWLLSSISKSSSKSLPSLGSKFWSLTSMMGTSESESPTSFTCTIHIHKMCTSYAHYIEWFSWWKNTKNGQERRFCKNLFSRHVVFTWVHFSCEYMYQYYTNTFLHSMS